MSKYPLDQIEDLLLSILTSNGSPGSPESKKNEVLCLFYKGERLRKKGKVDEAKTYFNKAWKINQSELKDQEMEAGILESLGFCYGDSGEYEKAIKTANDAIALYKHVSGKIGQVGIVHGLTHIGTIYSRLGKYKEAIAYQEKAIETSLRMRDEISLGLAYGNMGEAYNRINEHTKAIGLCEYALRLSRKTANKFEEARNLHNIGDAYNQMKDSKKCIKYCEESARIFTEIGNKKEASISHGVLAISYGRLGKLETSQAYFKSCIDNNLEVNQFHNLAIAYGNMGLGGYEIALLKFFLRFDDAENSLKSCIQSFKLAIEYTDKILGGLAVDSNRTALSDKFYRWYDSLTAPFNFLGRSMAALLFLDLGRAKILRHLVYNQVENKEEDRGNSGFESSWLTIENGKEKERIRTLSREIQLPESNATVLFYNFNRAEILTIWVLDTNGCVSLKTSNPSIKFSKSRQELEENIEKLLEKASVGFPRGYSFFQQSTVIDFEDANAKEYTSRNRSSHERAGEATSHDQKKAKVIDSTEKYRSPARRADESCDDLTKDTRSLLYRSLIDPVKSLIKGTKLIIAPQSCLFFAPFSSFIDGNGCLLSEQYQVQVIPSFHVLAISMEASRNKQIGGSLFVGNPEVEDGQFAPLPSAEEEVEYLASLLDAKPLTGRMATKGKVIDLMSNSSIIHIAAHGHEETGHIFLAPESSKPNDVAQPTSSSDLLTQSDVLECRLSARLVVLSCCHTGMGKLSSEGVLGIARSFLGAGASSVLVTLWKIDDQFTMEFMKVFYQKICEEKSACLALKETMNIFQRSGQYTSFLFWAAFEIIGEDVSFTKGEIEEIRRKNKDIFTSN